MAFNFQTAKQVYDNIISKYQAHIGVKIGNVLEFKKGKKFKKNTVDYNN